MRFAKRLTPGGGNLEITARAAAAAGFGIPQPRAHQSLSFEPAKGEIHGRPEHRASRMTFELVDDRHAVGVGAEADEREQDEVFETAQRF